MTTENHTLFDTLTLLAKLLPERIKCEKTRGQLVVDVFVSGHWFKQPAMKGMFLIHSAPVMLETALREEAESRGWRWWTFKQEDGRYGATVYQTGSEDDVLNADTPAHALALALVQALTEGVK